MTASAGPTSGVATAVTEAVHGIVAQVLPTAASQPWYEVATTIATLIAALGAIGAIIVGIFTIRQRADSDARAQWWSRVQWAVDLSFEEERSRRTVGFEALALLAASPLARAGDVEFLRGLTLDPLEGVQTRGEGPFSLTESPEPGGRVSSHSHRIPVGRDEVAAARLRSAVDAAEHVPTPTWIEELARTRTA
jgi:hypothetical protein